MTIRTTEMIVNFARLFTLGARPQEARPNSAVGRETPAGTKTARVNEADRQALERAENEGMTAPNR